MTLNNISEQMPFHYYTDELGELVEWTHDGVALVIPAMLNFRDTVNAAGLRYQYLELEVDIKHDIEQNDTIRRTAEGLDAKVWVISNEIQQTYSGARKYTASDGKFF